MTETDRQRGDRLEVEAGRAWFVFGVIILMFVVAGVSLLIFQTEQRNDAIDDMRQATARIEMAATHTEEVLVEVVEQRQTPEAIEQSQRVRAALDDIAAVRRLLCQLPELAQDPLCSR